MRSISTLTRGAVERAANDAHYAVLVGINYYEFLPALGGPLGDVASFRAWLVRPDGGGLPDPNVRRVNATTNPVDEPLAPTLTVIHRTLNAVNVEMKARIDQTPEVYDQSRLYLFVAGHGMSAPGTSAALFSTEAGPGMWGQTLDLQACAQWYVDHGPFAEVVLLADCCRTRYRDVSLMGVPFDKWSIDYRGKPPSVLTAYASLPDELAFEVGSAEDPNQLRGHFSRALVDALLSDVDPATGYVTGSSLEEGVRRRVHQLTDHPPPPPPPPAQTCHVIDATHTVLTFGPQHRDFLRRMTVHISAEAAGRGGTLQLLTGNKQLFASCDVAHVGPVWEEDVPIGLYRLRLVNADGTTVDGPIVDTDTMPEMLSV
jgi:hypothetical protein